VFLGSLLNPGEVINGADRAGGTAAKHLLLLAMGEPFFETATAAAEEENEAARKPALSTSQATSRPPKTLGPYDWRFNRLHRFDIMRHHFRFCFWEIQRLLVCDLSFRKTP
jgi:hypothetical protein